MKARAPYGTPGIKGLILYNTVQYSIASSSVLQFDYPSTSVTNVKDFLVRKYRYALYNTMRIIHDWLNTGNRSEQL
jgi:hypothetical protein